MNWIVKYLTSSIGRKQIMGVTGVLIALWIFMHMVGNLVLLGPAVAYITGGLEAFRTAYAETALGYNSYSWMLTHNKAVLIGMEIVLGLALVLHFYMAITLNLENRKARPVGYLVNAKVGKKSFATFTMIYSGIWILVYLIFHIKNLKLGTHLDVETTKLIIAGFQLDYNESMKIRDMFTTTITEFGKPGYALLYVFSTLVLGLHLVHAIGSSIQTMGINHQRWNGIIKAGSIGFATVVSIGFALEAVACFIIGSVMNGRFQ